MLEDFDIFDRCLVSYNNDSQIFVYSVVSEIYAIYNMTLPFYKKYEGFKLVKFSEDGDSLRGYYEQFLALLMYRESTKEFMIFIYCLKCNQHDTFVLAYDLTDFFN